MDVGAALGTGLGTGLLPTGPPPAWPCLLLTPPDEEEGEAAAGLGAEIFGLGPALNMSSMWAVLDCASATEEEAGAAAALGALKKSAKPSGVAAWVSGLGLWPGKPD